MLKQLVIIYLLFVKLKLINQNNQKEKRKRNSIQVNPSRPILTVLIAPPTHFAIFYSCHLEKERCFVVAPSLDVGRVQFLRFFASN